MASSQQGGSGSGASTQQDSDSDTIHLAAGNTIPSQGTGTAPAAAPNAATPAEPPASVLAVAPPPAHQASLRGDRWYEDEEWFVWERLAEEPRIPWSVLVVRHNEHFQTRPVLVGGQLVQRGNRTNTALRLHFGGSRNAFQARLNAQNGVGNHLAVATQDEDSAEDEEENDEQEVQGLAQILSNAIEKVESPEDDTDDEGAGGDGAAIAP
ncbi:hypothetical protein PRZ48_004920 [Zasmidium cellare]|uniref:Uncharacterized protein n=1 Tax=Zasmidium cellare TaxID=395010 RepID=A0ABR0ER95_ZASCE|nr:hypothetical protein PRZ48_004920 [Zasmidium cellare]